MANTFYYTNPTTLAKTVLFDCLRGNQGSTLSTGLKINNVEQTTYGIPITNSYATLPYGYPGPLGYKYDGIDIGLRFGPKGIGFSGSGTYTLHASTTKFLIMAVGGGGGGGSGGTWSTVSGTSGNSGTGGSCVYAAYPVVAGQSVISFTIGGGGAGALGVKTGVQDGRIGSTGGTTTVSYNGVTYVTAPGGPGGQAGYANNTRAILANATPTNPTYRTPLANSLVWRTGTYTGNPSRLVGPIVAPDNSGWNNQTSYVNTSSSGQGNGGHSG